MTKRVDKPTIAAALAGTIVLALSGCGMTGPGETMTIDEARSQAATELRPPPGGPS